MKMWLTSQKHPDAPAYSGGVLDAWPAIAVDALAIARDEVGLIHSYVEQEGRRG